MRFLLLTCLILVSLPSVFADAVLERKLGVVPNVAFCNFLEMTHKDLEVSILFTELVFSLKNSHVKFKFPIVAYKDIINALEKSLKWNDALKEKDVKFVKKIAHIKSLDKSSLYGIGLMSSDDDSLGVLVLIAEAGDPLKQGLCIQIDKIPALVEMLKKIPAEHKILKKETREADKIFN